MSECTHDCSSCGESCAERKEVNPFEKKPLHEGCRVRKVYGVVSGKGGVGKSMVTCQLAVALRREGYRTAILDADITWYNKCEQSRTLTTHYKSCHRI